MATSKGRRWLLPGLALLLLVAALLAAGWYAGARELKSRVERALGPQGEVAEIRLSPAGVEVLGLRLKAPPGWPAPETLRAARIVVVPDIGSLLSGKIGLARITVEGAYLSALRGADGRLRVVPSLLEAKGGEADPSGSAVRIAIASVELHDGVLEFFDATVRGRAAQGAHRVRLEQLQASVTDIRLPELDRPSQLHLSGVVKGPGGDGKLLIDGWMNFSSRDSSLRNSLRGVDLAAFQPYLLKASDSGVKRGTLDLDLRTTVKAQHLHAPGTLTLDGLELEASGTFMGLPRAAVLGLMKDRNGRIGLDFTLEGRIDDPAFRLNEGFSTRVASSLGDALGVSVEGLARGAGAVGQKGLEAAGGAARGAGKAVGRIFGR